MKLGVRSKLFVLAVLLTVGVHIISGIYLEFCLRNWLEAQSRDDLLRQARVALEMIHMAAEPNNSHDLSYLAFRLGNATDVRVTLISSQGDMLGDSHMEVSEVYETENHLHRIEVQDALLKGQGVARRLSETLYTPMLYAALPFDKSDVHGVIRVAMSLMQIDEAIHKLRLMLLAAGLVGLAASLSISGLASHYISRALLDLYNHAKKIAQGESNRRMVVWPADEIGGIAGSFNQVANNLERVVNTLGHERNQIATILDSMTEAVLAFDASQHITLINGAAIELLGLAPQQQILSMRPVKEVIHNMALRELLKQATSQTCVRDELLLGDHRVLARVTPLKTSGGSVVVMHDITELRRLETMRRDFVTNVSHELRTPVSIIQANAETLLNGALGDTQAAYSLTEALFRNAERLGHIIADLLDISRIEAGKFKLNTEPVCLVAAVERATAVLQPKAVCKQVSLKMLIGNNTVVWGDMQALDQILVNLLDNAIKYTPDNGHISVATVVSDFDVTLQVIDDGPGLAPHHHSRVFERFYRADAGRSRHEGGTGLGLSIVKHLCENMGGTVGVKLHEPQGTVFWVKLPRYRQKAA